MRLIALILASVIAAAPATAQSWREYRYPNDSFTVSFPSDPAVETTTYKTADGSPADARVSGACPPKIP